MTKGLLAVLIIWSALIGPAGAEGHLSRVDLFDLQGRRTGYALIDTRSGRVDFDGVNARRTGWGRIGASQRAERFSLDGKRQDDFVLPHRSGREERRVP